MLQEGCSAQPVQQALPQDTKHLALASYTNDTSCKAVLEDTSHATSYGSKLKLEFVDTSSLASQGLTYHVCTDVTWYVRPQGILGLSNETGPVDTFLWFYNPCSTSTTISFNVSRLIDGVQLLVSPCLVTSVRRGISPHLADHKTDMLDADLCNGERESSTSPMPQVPLLRSTVRDLRPRTMGS